MNKDEFEAWLDDDASLYEVCDDPDCPVAYAFVWPPERHYHPKTGEHATGDHPKTGEHAKGDHPRMKPVDA